MNIKNGYIAEPAFKAAFQTLFSRPVTAKQCLELNQASDELDAHLRVILKSKYQIMEKYAKKNEDGKMITEDNGNVVFPDDATKLKCSEEVMEIMNEVYDIPLSSKIIVYEDETLLPLHYSLLKDIIEIKERPKA
jgi:hypothetical protein